MTPETPIEIKANLDTKASVADVGGAFDELMTSFESFRETNDQADVQIERRCHVDPLTADKLARLDREVADNKRRMDELTLKGLRPAPRRSRHAPRPALRRRPAAQGSL